MDQAPERSLADAFGRGDSSPGAELRACLDRIDRREGTIKAFVNLAVDRARAEAAASDARWRAGRPLSPVDGMIVGVKDVIETADMPTGQGSRMWDGVRTGRDAACVHALREAGAIILGKCTTTEFAFVAPLHETANPHDLSRTPGGSSSGSAAAVAAGFVHCALGTQVLGSTLRPASYCGCIGFKPSLGALNRSGSFDYQSQGCLGILGRHLDDIWAVAAAIASRVGGDPGYPTFSDRDRSVVARMPKALAILQPTAMAACGDGALAAFRQICARLDQAGVRLFDAGSDARIAAFEAKLAQVGEKAFAIVDWEHLWPVEAYRRAAADGVSEMLSERMDKCRRTMTLDDYHALLAWRSALRDDYARMAAGYDAVITLAATGAAPFGLATTGDPALNIPASTLGVPAVSLPLLADAGLPLGLQLIGRAGEDIALLDVAGGICAFGRS